MAEHANQVITEADISSSYQMIRSSPLDFKPKEVTIELIKT